MAKGNSTQNVVKDNKAAQKELSRAHVGLLQALEQTNNIESKDGNRDASISNQKKEEEPAARTNSGSTTSDSQGPKQSANAAV